ncbi:unnamed protein product [Candida verbasci]|uniref:Uncharacterized protein n=1 Tax=Candida verbasci TaxID=1227364 RepID=A0A9W4TTX5_9ASCO|nr:unnamed protein product [Candida verbasci]
MSIDYLWTDDELTQFEREALFSDTTFTFTIISKTIDECLLKLNEFFKPWLDEYPWNLNKPKFDKFQYDQEFYYIYGELSYHDYSQDSNLLLAILFLFTKFYDCFIHVWDNELVEPILFHCHEILPENLQDVTTSQNRIWIHDYKCIEINQHTDNYLNLKRAIYQLSNNDYGINTDITNKIIKFTQLDEYLGDIHDLKLCLPINFAKLVSNEPMLISKCLIELEDIEQFEPLLYNENLVDVTVPVNSMNLGVLLSITHENQLNDFKKNASEIIMNGLVKLKNKLTVNEVPNEIKRNSRDKLQNILIDRGLLTHNVDENKEIYDIILNSPKDSIQREEQLAKQLEAIFEEGTIHLQEVINEDDWEEEEEEDELTDDELNLFRWKYYDTTSEWIPKKEVKLKYDQFNQSMLKYNEEFKNEFKNTDFEDFPEFLESEVILEMHKPNNTYNNDSDYENENSQSYEGDMSYSEYLKFKKQLRKNPNETINSDTDEDDVDWEDIKDDDDSQDVMSDDSQEYIEPYDIDTPRVQELPNFSPEEETVEGVTENLKNLKTKDK